MLNLFREGNWIIWSENLYLFPTKNGASIWMRILWIPIIFCDHYNYILNLCPEDLLIKFVFLVGTR